jgi:hypothetical protein
VKGLLDLKTYIATNEENTSFLPFRFFALLEDVPIDVGFATGQVSSSGDCEGPSTILLVD